MVDGFDTLRYSTINHSRSKTIPTINHQPSTINHTHPLARHDQR